MRQAYLVLTLHNSLTVGVAIRLVGLGVAATVAGSTGPPAPPRPMRMPQMNQPRRPHGHWRQWHCEATRPIGVAATASDSERAVASALVALLGSAFDGSRASRPAAMQLGRNSCWSGWALIESRQLTCGWYSSSAPAESTRTLKSKRPFRLVRAHRSLGLPNVLVRGGGMLHHLPRL
jgi:hypothetical protein